MKRWCFAILLTLGVTAFALPGPSDVLAKQKQTAQKHQKQKSKKASRKARSNSQPRTKYNFRARTYYPWYEGYEGWERLYMPFDRNYGY